MKLRKNLILILIIIGMLPCSITALAMTTATKEENYKAAVLQLETYLETSGDNSAELAGILSAFNELGGYEQSKFLGYYVSVLMKIADEQYNFVLTTYLDMLEANTSFNNYLQDTLKGSSICSVDNLKAYSLGRECEHKGENNKAIDYYKQCMSFYDASDRYFRLIDIIYQEIFEQAFELLGAGNYVEAYFQFASIAPYNDSDLLMASIVNQLEYTPSSPDDILKPVTDLKAEGTNKDSITLSWTASPHAQTYEVYYKESGSPEWVFARNTKSTEITIRQLASNFKYDFMVISAIDKIKAKEALLTGYMLATPSPTPTVKPTKKPTSTATPKPSPTNQPSKPRLGVTIRQMTSTTNLLEVLPKGLVIFKIASGSPAEKAGLRVGDIITAIKKQRIRTVDELHNILNTCKIGETISLRIHRNDAFAKSVQDGTSGRITNDGIDFSVSVVLFEY